MQEPRSNFAIAWADDGRLFAIGGQTGPEKITATVEMLNIATTDAADGAVNGCWNVVASLYKPRKHHAVAFIGGKVVVVGGENDREVECFTLPTNEHMKGACFLCFKLTIAL